MDYAKIYDDFYFKYYTKAEDLIKSYFINCKIADRPFGYAINQIRIRLRDHIMIKLNIEQYACLKSLHELFTERYSSHGSNEIQGIFNDEIKIDYAKIKLSELPENYSYTHLIKDIAIFEIVIEILRLLQNNSALFEKFYKLNDYQKFEIKEYGDILERTSIFKELDLILNPIIKDNRTKTIASQNTKFEQSTKFNIALKFATGEAQELYFEKKHLRGHFKIICLDLGFKESDRPYFSETISENSSDKNLLQNLSLMQYVAKYCELNEIKICSSFLTKLRKLEY